MFGPSEPFTLPGSCVNPGGGLVVKTSDSDLHFQNSCAEEIFSVSAQECSFVDYSVYFSGCGFAIYEFVPCASGEWNVVGLVRTMLRSFQVDKCFP